ncbi:hypothetical protein ACFZDI_29490 [Streptomyces sp. NPDC007907]|uniref:hypothetical protein n=1 Tax=Streptomyces sp. NPDC007907 TaxID=3364789 RepID=UPI0036E33AA1
MSDDALTKALAAAAEASSNSKQLELMQAVVIGQALAQAMQQPHSCQHDHQPRKEFDARKWWTIGGFAVVGGCVACALAIAFAVATVAFAIGATCATGCFLVLRSMWRDYLNNR